MEQKRTTNPRVGIPPPGYRLPDATRLGPVRLQVADLSRSVRFYTNVLGLRVLDAADDRAVLGAGDRPLVEVVARPGVRAVPPRGRLGLFHVAILLPDRARLGRFVRHASDLGIRLGMSDHLVSEAVYLSDPDGLGIELYADRPREDWDRVGSEIRMTTEPLDVAAVVSAAGTEPWAEAPSGTRIGHVHLHVGDLDEAAKFYHEALGFDKTVWSYPGALFLSAGGYHHHVGTNVWARGAPPARADDARLLEWTVVLPSASDVEPARRSLEAAGYPVTAGRDAWTAADPWGTVVRVASA